jgi:hypothetical protein
MEQILDQQAILKLQEQFLGKKVSIQNDKGRYVGICQFIGYNEFFPSWNFQVTLDRTPFSNVKIKSVHLVEDKKLFD